MAKERALVVPQLARKTEQTSPDGTQQPGFVIEFHNAGHAPGTITITQWSFVQQPFWPEGFDDIHLDKRTLVPDGPGRSPFMPEEKPFQMGEIRFLVGQVTYETLEDERYITPFSFRVERLDDHFGTANHTISIWPIHGMPHHT